VRGQPPAKEPQPQTSVKPGGGDRWEEKEPGHQVASFEPLPTLPPPEMLTAQALQAGRAREDVKCPRRPGFRAPAEPAQPVCEEAVCYSAPGPQHSWL
jgi:hypothetical protein